MALKHLILCSFPVRNIFTYEYRSICSKQPKRTESTDCSILPDTFFHRWQLSQILRQLNPPVPHVVLPEYVYLSFLHLYRKVATFVDDSAYGVLIAEETTCRVVNGVRTRRDSAINFCRIKNKKMPFWAVDCPVRLTTQTNGGLMLRSCLFKHEMKIFVDNTPMFVYIYFHEGGFISAITH